MEFETEFAVGEKVFFMENNLVNSGVIERIDIKVYSYTPKEDDPICAEQEGTPYTVIIVYKIRDKKTEGKKHLFQEHLLFESKAQLLNSL